VLVNSNLSVRQTLVADSSIVINKIPFPAALSGDTVFYTIKITNHGPQTAYHFSLWDNIPDSLTAFGFSPPVTKIQNDTLFWEIDSLVPGDSLAFRFEAQLADSLPLPQFFMPNECGIWAVHDTVSTDNYAITTLVGLEPDQPLPPVLCDVSVTQVVQTDSFEIANEDTTWYARAGEVIRYTLIIQNLSPIVAESVSVTNTFPDSLILGDFQPPFDRFSTDSVFWNVGTIPAAGLFTIKFSAAVAEEMPVGENWLVNKAVVAAVNEDSTKLANNISVSTVLNVVTPVVSEWEPLIEASPALVEIGKAVTVRVQVTAPVKIWDLWVYAPTGKIDSTYADVFIAQTVLEPNQWLPVEPPYIPRKKFTDARQEPLRFELRAVDYFDKLKTASATISTISGNQLIIDRNVFVPTRDGQMKIDFQLKRAGSTQLEIFDITGTKITTLTDSEYNAGWNTYLWDGQTENGQKIGSGFYIITLRSNGFYAWKKLMIVR